MGVTKKPLKILATDIGMLTLLQPYTEKGHTITLLEGYDFHVVMGPRAHRLSEAALREMPEKAVELALKGAQAVVYPPKRSKG